MKSLDYLDFDLALLRSGQHYKAKLLDSPGGQAENEFSLPFTEQELTILLLTLNRPRRQTRRLESTDEEAVKKFGGKLFKQVFGGDVLSCLRTSEDEATRRGKGLRIKLRLADVPELADLPWEYLYNEPLNRFFALSEWTPVVRFLELPERVSPFRVSLPLRVLVMISSPTDLSKIRTEDEWTLLHRELDKLSANGLLEIDRVNTGSISALESALKKQEYHIFHFIGHGEFMAGRDDGFVAFEDAMGKSDLASGQDLGILLHDFKSLRLVVLNSCEGARPSRSDPYSGVAQSLIQQGIPAVIAMQFEISDDVAVVFSQRFYRAIAEGYDIDRALSDARRKIYSDFVTEWGTPVLYLRAKDGQIFDISVDPNNRLPLSDVEGELLRARTYWESDDIQKATAILEEVVKKAPDNGKARWMLLESRRREEIAQLLKVGLQELETIDSPDEPRALLRLRELAPDSFELFKLAEAYDVRHPRLRRPLLARVLLLYKPIKAWGWILHLLFYAFVFMALIAFVMSANDYWNHVPDAVAGLGGSIAILCLAFGVNIAAHALDRRSGNRGQPLYLGEILTLAGAILFSMVGIIYLYNEVFGSEKLTLYSHVEHLMVWAGSVALWTWYYGLRALRLGKVKYLLGLLSLSSLAVLCLLVAFGVTLIQVKKGLFPEYSATARAIALIIGCLSLRVQFRVLKRLN
jgi:hypothetical protein